MTPQEAISRVLNSVNGVEIGADANEAIATLLRAGVVLCGIALMRLSPCDREVRLEGIEEEVREYIAQVLARRSPYPRAGNGHAPH